MKTENAKIKKINVPYIKKLLPRRLFNSASAYVQSLGLHFEVVGEGLNYATALSVNFVNVVLIPSSSNVL